MGKIAVWAVLYPIVAHIGIQTSHTNLPIIYLMFRLSRLSGFSSTHSANCVMIGIFPKVRDLKNVYKFVLLFSCYIL
jgi:hypothetical protein